MCKNTATKRSPVFLAETLVWVVISSPCAFSARGSYETTCALPLFSAFFPFSPFPAPSLRFRFAPIDAGYSHTWPSQIPERNPGPTARAPPPSPARHARARCALRVRADLRRDLDLGARYHGHVPG